MGRRCYIMTTPQTGSQPLSFDDWIEAGLLFITDKGRSQLSIDGVATCLGVTKGAFYGHFNHKADFENALLQHYVKMMADQLAMELSQMESPQDQLKALINRHFECNQSRLSLRFRAWGLDNPEVSEELRKVDQFRFKQANYMFQELGFSKGEAQVRSHMLLTLLQGESCLYSQLSPAERIEQIEVLYCFFAAPRETPPENSDNHNSQLAA